MLLTTQLILLLVLIMQDFKLQATYENTEVILICSWGGGLV